MVTAVGALVSFQEGSDLLRELAGVSVGAKQVEGLDAGIPMRRSELPGRAGKQPDGSSKTREVKLAAIRSAASTTADRSEFTERVLRETTRRRFGQASRPAVIGDRAPWIWNIAPELFPAAVHIVDRFHAREHLSTVAKALYGATNPRAAEWAKRRHAPSCEEARKCTGYIRNNRARTQSPDFRWQKPCTPSGVVEAGRKVVVGTRLKRAGMHRTEHGSNAIIALRACRLSGRFQDFWRRRSQRTAA